ncbi:MAG: hypothetical protein DBX52_04425 [Clostridiales bacterium]|nr:MAG: hypothetical protein DBX52_04425 [Clostridiales bacterium]
MKTAFYAAAHFAVDCCCALFLFRFLLYSSDWAFALLLYNFCAFALQMPFGILADCCNRNGLFAAGGMLLSACAFLFAAIPLWGAVCAGCANALFHIGGGLEILNQSEKKAAALGVFVAPGAGGLLLGTLLGKSSFPILPVPLILCAAGTVLALLAGRPSANAAFTLPRFRPAILPLFLVVVLRSYLGFCMQFRWNTSLWTSLAAAAALILGKMAGGFLLDRYGFFKTAGFSLLLAAAFLLAPNYMVFGLAGVFFFQMTMPVTLWAAAALFPGAKGFVFGLLTFALFIGFLPALLGAPLPGGGLFYSGGALVSLLLLYLAGRRMPL